MKYLVSVLILAFLTGCASYRKRSVTIADIEGIPASGHQVSFHNMIPFPIFPPIESVNGVLDGRGSTVLRLPLVTGRFQLGNEAVAILSREEIEKGVSAKRFGSFPIGLPETWEAEPASKWHLTITKP